MTKIVINTCFGGFGLSVKAIEFIAQRKGVALTWEDGSYSGALALFDGEYFDESMLSRTDPDLIAAVEELGDDASSSLAELRIEELAPGTRYRINDYDGNESIQTPDDIKWSVA